MTIQPNIWYVLGSIYVFFTLFGYWVWGGEGGGSPKGLVHDLLMQFFTLGSSKIVDSETYFSYIVTTQNDQPTYVKHGLRQYLCAFHPIWVLGAGGGGGVLSQEIGTQPAHAVFHLGQLKNGSFRNLLFWIS